MDSNHYNAASDFVDTNVREGRGGKLAFRDAERELTYGQLQERVARVGPAFSRLGVRREERVLLLMQDTIDFPVVFWGAIRAGIVPVPLNTLLGADQYRYILADSRAGLVVVSEALFPILQDALSGITDPVQVVVASETEGRAAGPRRRR